MSERDPLHLDQLLDRCTITVPTSIVNAIGEKTLELFQRVKPGPSTLYDRVRQRTWETTVRGARERVRSSTSNILSLYSNVNPNAPNGEDIGPAWLTVVDMTATKETMKPTKMYLYLPEDFNNAEGVTTEAGLIVARGVRIDITSKPPVDNQTL